MTSTNVFEILEQLEELPRWTPAAVGAVLRVAWRRNAQTSNEYYTMYENSGTPSELWRSVELRAPAEPDRQGLIILELGQREPLPMDEVVKRFGNEYSFSPVFPDPPGGSPLHYYQFKRARGVLSVRFRDFNRYTAEIFILDRM